MSETAAHTAVFIDRYDVAIRVGKYFGMGIDRDLLATCLDVTLPRDPQYLPPTARTVMHQGQEYEVDHAHVYIERRGYPDEDSWAITFMGTCLDAMGEWEWEAQPSSRSAEFIERTRFGLDEALHLCRTHGIITE